MEWWYGRNILQQRGRRAGSTVSPDEPESYIVEQTFVRTCDPWTWNFFAILLSLHKRLLNFLTTPLNAYQSFFRWRLVLTLSGFLFPLAAFRSSPSTLFASAFLTSYWLNVLPSQVPNGVGNSSWCHWILSSVALSPLQRQQQEKSTNVYVKKRAVHLISVLHLEPLRLPLKTRKWKLEAC